jgi:hippurate hydrolase
LANVDSVDITVKGVGGHGAWPHKTKDPIVLAAQIVLALQTIVSREISPLDSAVVTVGSIHGGDKHNIIGEEVKLQLTVRSYSDETRKQILDSIRRITLNTARAFGVPADREPVVKVAEEEFTPSTYNTPELVERLLPVWRETLGPENVVKTEPVMGGEDFSRFGRTEPKVPITIFWLGTIDKARFDRGGLPPLHSPLFWPDAPPAIRTGVRAMTATALELLGKP